MIQILPLLFIFVLQLGLSRDASSATIQVSFGDLARYVREKNPHVKAAESLTLGANRRTGYLFRSYLPAFSATGGYESFQTGPYRQLNQPYGGIEATVNLFRGGRDLLEESARQGASRFASAAEAESYLNKLTEARRNYLHLAYYREVIAILNETIAQNEKNLSAAHRRITSGVATETDRIEFEMYRIQIGQDLARMKLEEDSALKTLTVLLGESENLEIRVPSDALREHDESLLKASFDAKLHREVELDLSAKATAEARKKSAHRWWSPSVDAYGSYSLYTLRDRDYVSQRDRFEVVGGVRVTFELFDGLKSYAEGSALASEADAYEQRALQTERELKTRFERTRAQLGLAYDQARSAEASIEQGRKYLKRTLEEYGRGVKNSPDVLNATQKFMEWRRRATDLMRDYQLARVELLRILGR